MTTNQKGTIAEAEIRAAAIRLGYVVLQPANERGRYDLALDDGNRILRVQCKWAPKSGDVILVRTETCRLTPDGYVKTVYTPDEIDAVAAYCPDLDACYLVPVAELDGRRMLSLRLAPAKNGQRAAVRMASEYEFGAIAQLGERVTGSHEVVGSSPTSSTSSNETVIGSHEFRERFGWYLERASAGERFAISRHGRPYARLCPAS